MISISKKITATFLLISVFASQLLAPPAAFAAPRKASPDFADYVPVSGHVEQIWNGKDSRTVFLIQDAHAAGDAQASIQRLLGELQGRGLELVFLEGASGEIDPVLFRAFPDRKILEKIFGEYRSRGEISGTVTAAVLNAPGLSFHGVENETEYREGVRKFLEALNASGPDNGRIHTLKTRLRQLKEKYDSGPALNASRLLEQFEENPGSVYEITALEGILKVDAVKYPRLAAVFTQILQDRKEKENGLENEITAVSGMLSSRVRDAGNLQRLNEALQDYRTEKITLQALAATTVSIARTENAGISFSQAFLEQARIQETLDSIRGSEFFDEFHAYGGEIKRMLFKTEEEKSLDRFGGEMKLFEKLSMLELSRKDLENLKKIESAWLENKTADTEIGVFENELRSFFRAGLNRLSAHLDFYKNAEKREADMLKNALDIMARKKQKTAVLVTGGFHSEGLIAGLRERGISYRLITPEMHEIPQPGLYLDTMRGHVSWKNYFEIKNGNINLYDAFSRAVTERLMQEVRTQDAASAGTVLREWRSRLFADLASQGDLSRAAGYTVFMDRISPASVQPEWSKVVDGFLNHLQNLKEGNRLTPENVSAWNPAANMILSWTSVPLVRNRRVPANFYIPAARSESRIAGARAEDEDSPLQKLAKAHGPLKIGIIAPRAGTSDDVAKETRKWIEVLKRAGHQVRVLAAEGSVDIEGVETDLMPPSARTDDEGNQRILAGAFSDLKTSGRHPRLDDIRKEGEISGDEAHRIVGSKSAELEAHITGWSKQHEFDVLIVENLNAVPEQIPLGVAIEKVASHLKTAMIFHQHEAGPTERTKFHGPRPFIRPYLKEAFPPKRSDVVQAFISQYAIDQQRHEEYTEQPSLARIANAENFDSKAPEVDDYNRDLKKEIGLSEDDIMIVHPAPVIERKGLEFTLKMLKNISNPKVKLVVMTDGYDPAYRAQIEDYIRELKLQDRVVFMGKRLSDKRGTIDGGVKTFTAADVYAHAALATFPSLWEGFGHTLLELFQARLPVVVYPYTVYTTDIADKGFEVLEFPGVTNPDLNPTKLRGILRHEHYRKKLEALAGEVEKLLADPGRRKEMGDKNFALAKQSFSYENLDAQLASAIASAIALRAKQDDEVVQRFASYEGQQLLERLAELNTIIDAAETPVDRAIALRRLRTDWYIPAVKRAFGELSRNLMSELPANIRLMKTVAAAMGVENEFEALDFPMIPVLKKVIESDAWETLAANRDVVAQLLERSNAFRRYLADKNTWVALNAPDLLDEEVVYVSAEYGLEWLKIYTGGLGILSGDHVRGASDLGLNFTGIGLLYKKGYFRQRIDAEGHQGVLQSYQGIRTEDLPLQEAGPNGTELIIDVPLPSKTIKAKVWKVSYGRVNLLLLDTDIPANDSETRLISEHIYRKGGGSRERMEQYFLLGAGGQIARRALGKKKGIIHMNDGHPVFSAIQAVRFAMDDLELEKDADPRLRFETALEQVMARAVFTTHTPIAAGNESVPLDRFRDFLVKIFGDDNYAIDRILAMGTYNGSFNLTVFSLRATSQHNAVSELHAAVARKMWQPLYPGVAPEEVPIKDIVNSVHTEYFQSEPIAALFAETFSEPEVAGLMKKPEAFDQLMDKLSDGIWIDEKIKVTDEDLWDTHVGRKQALFDEMLRRTQARKDRGDATQEEVDYVKTFTTEALTVGFARRFIEYKRALLVLDDLDRLEGIAKDSGKPIQFVFGGKAHPEDRESQEIIAELHRRAKELRRRGTDVKIVFIEEYDIKLARVLEAGVDIWLNTPIRPREASGTSGMKAAMNGALNFSSKDGWWVEGGRHNVNGFMFGIDGDDRDDLADAQDLYRKFEEVVAIYNRDRKAWIRKMKAAIVASSYYFGMERMLRWYAEDLYSPAAKADRELSADEARRKAAARLEHADNMTKRASGDSKPDVSIDPFKERVASGVSTKLTVSVNFQGGNPDDYAVDIILVPEQISNKPDEQRALEIAKPVERVPAGDNVFRFAFSAAPKYEGRYQVRVRVTPKDQTSWTQSNLDQVTAEKKSEKDLIVENAHTLKLRAESGQEDGMLFYVRVPKETGAARVRWASLATQWEKEALEMRLVDGSEDIYAVVVPSNVAGPDREYHFKFIIDLPNGSKRWVTGHYPVKSGNAVTAISEESPLYRRDKAATLLKTLTGEIIPPPAPETETAPVATYVINDDDASILLRANGGGFEWNTGSGNRVASAPGFWGFLRAYESMSEENLNASILYHLGNRSADKPAGDIFYYILENLLKNVDSTITEVKGRIAKLQHEVIHTMDTPDEKIAATRRALRLVDEIAASLAWKLALDFGKGKPEALAAFQDRENGDFIRKRLVAYLKTQAKPAATIDGDTVQAFQVPLQLFIPDAAPTQRALIVINRGKRRLGDPERVNTTVRAAGIGAILGQDTMNNLKAQIQVTSLAQRTSGGAGTGYLKQVPVAELIQNGLPLEILGPQDLDIIVFSAAEPEAFAAYLEAAVKNRDPWEKTPAQLIRQEIQKRLAANGEVGEEAKAFLRQVVSYGVLRARNMFGIDGIPVVMAFIATLAPDLLDEMKSWDESVYKILSAELSGVRKDIYHSGIVQFYETSPTTALVFSKTYQGRRIFMPFYFGTIPAGQLDADGKIGISVPNAQSLGLNFADGKELQVRNVLTNRVYGTVHTAETLGVQAGRDTTGRQMGGWHVRVPGEERFQLLEWVDAEIKAPGARHKYENLMFMIPTVDLGTEIVDGQLVTRDSLGKFREIMGFLAAKGYGKFYFYGGLFKMSESSREIHSVKDKRAKTLPVDNDRVTVRIGNYRTKRQTVTVNGQQVLIRDDGGNPFSFVLTEDMLPELNPEIFSDPTMTQAERVAALKQLIKDIQALGIKVILDFVPWLAPEAVNEKNYKWFFYKELSESDRLEYEGLKTAGKKQAFIDNLVEHGEFFAVKITEGGKERVILVRHVTGAPNIDQAMPNPFSPGAREYYKNYLKFLIDLGADGARVDLAGKLISIGGGHNDVRGIFETPGLALDDASRFRDNDELWPVLVETAKEYAGRQTETAGPNKGRPKNFEFVFESYDDERQALRDRGAKGETFYFTEAYMAHMKVERRTGALPSEVDGRLKQAADAQREGMNLMPIGGYDHISMKQIGGSRLAQIGKEYLIADAGVPVASDLIDNIDVERLRTMPGGDIGEDHQPDPNGKSSHTWETDAAKIERRSTWAGLKQIILEGDGFKVLDLLNKAIREKGEEVVDTQIDSERRDEMSVIGVREPETGSWTLVASDHRLNDGDTRSRWIGLPHRIAETADPKHLTAIDVATGETLKIDNGRIFGVNFGPGPGNSVRIIRVERKQRSEMRQVAENMFGALASGNAFDTKLSAEIVEGVEAGWDGVDLRAIAIRPEYARTYESRMESPARLPEFYGAHPDYEEKLAAFVQAQTDAIRGRLNKIAQSDSGSKLVFAFAIRMPQSPKVRAWLLNYLKMISAVAAEYPQRVQGRVRILAPAADFRDDEELKRFRGEAERTGVARIIEMNTPGTAYEVKQYFTENPNALGYGLEDLKVPGFEDRIVRTTLDVDNESVFTVASLLTYELAEATDKNSVDRTLRQVSRNMPGLRYSKEGIQITFAALELSYRGYQLTGRSA